MLEVITFNHYHTKHLFSSQARMLTLSEHPLVTIRCVDTAPGEDDEERKAVVCNALRAQPSKGMLINRMGYVNCVLIKTEKDPNLNPGTEMSCEVALSSADKNRSHAVEPGVPARGCLWLFGARPQKAMR